MMITMSHMGEGVGIRMRERGTLPLCPVSMAGARKNRKRRR